MLLYAREMEFDVTGKLCCFPDVEDLAESGNYQKFSSRCTATFRVPCPDDLFQRYCSRSKRCCVFHKRWA
jgi:hypothetical protein